MGKFSWLGLNHWRISKHDKETFEETKRFIASYLDNIRTKSTREPYLLDGKHRDWLSIYLRDQDPIKDHFIQIIDQSEPEI